LSNYAVFNTQLTPLLTDTAVGKQPGLHHSSAFIIIIIHVVLNMWLTGTAVGKQPKLPCPNMLCLTCDSLHCLLALQLASNLAWNIHHQHHSVFNVWLIPLLTGTAVGQQPGMEHSSSSFIVIIIIQLSLNMWLTGTAVGKQPGLEHLLLQAAQPQPGPQVCLNLLGTAVCNHHHFPLDPAIFGCAAAACSGLGCAAVLLEPQRVAQQQGGHSQRHSEDSGAEGAAATGRHG